MSDLDQATETTADELLRLEMMLLDPDVRRDIKRVAALLAEDFVEFGSSGRVWTRDAILQLLASESYAQLILEDFACRMLSADVALVTYRSERSRLDGGGLPAEALRSSLWVRRQGKWKMSFHQGTPRG